LSAASGWEIAIKARLGRLNIESRDAADFVAEQVAANAFQVLPIHLNHAF
jgi:PIN domain nuclease of toxin-antitoxin system